MNVNLYEIRVTLKDADGGTNKEEPAKSENDDISSVLQMQQ